VLATGLSLRWTNAARDQFALLVRGQCLILAEIVAFEKSPPKGAQVGHPLLLPMRWLNKLPRIDPEVAERDGSRCRQGAGDLDACKGVRLPAVAILPGSGYSGEIADVGEEILRAHHVRGGNADGLADCIHVGHEQRTLQFSGKAQRLECARLLAARHAAVSPDCDQPRGKYELACPHRTARTLRPQVYRS
jgi:hypothetical protein